MTSERIVLAQAWLMDLTSALSSLQQSRTAQDIQFSVARKMLDHQRQQGAAALQLLEAANIAPGDALVAQATGLGGQLDVRG